MTSYYFCMGPVLDQAEKDEAAAGQSAGGLITVSREPMACHGHIDDGFVLANPVHIMRLDDAMAVEELARLIADVPLYHFNMKLVLDEALTERHRNKSVQDALIDGFEGSDLPPTISKIEAQAGSHLRHPLLDDMDAESLSRVYVQFLMSLRRYKEDFSFQRNILGHHTDEFLKEFDGFFEEGLGKIRSRILLAFGLRNDHDPQKPLEGYVSRGQLEARKKNISEAHELVWAWAECDDYQHRRCLDVHRVMKLTTLPRLPNWVRMDIFRFHEMEAMKQVFAEKLVTIDPDMKVLEGALTLKRAIRLSAIGQVDGHIQQLMEKITNPSTIYADSALHFATSSALREKESHNIKLG